MVKFKQFTKDLMVFRKFVKDLDNNKQNYCIRGFGGQSPDPSDLLRSFHEFSSSHLNFSSKSGPGPSAELHDWGFLGGQNAWTLERNFNSRKMLNFYEFLTKF